MRVRILQQCDEPGTWPRRALFDGQFYEVADEAAQELIASGLAESVEPEPAAEPEPEPEEAPEEDEPKPKRRSRR